MARLKYTPEQQITTFWNCVTITADDNKCWEWQAYRDRKGYGCKQWDGKRNKAHRVSWILANGDIPDGLFVLHTCDNPPCCNPKHLFLGTHLQNMKDRDRKGRQLKGESHPCHKLTVNQIIEIRQRYKAGNISYRALGREYKIDKHHVKLIITRELWKHVL